MWGRKYEVHEINPVILSCKSLTEYVKQAQKKCATAFPIVELNREYHDEPEKMREHILQTLEQLPEEIDTVLVAMGFCGGSWQGISSDKTIVIPRISDCVALTLTTTEQFDPDPKEMGHMYLFGEKGTGFSVQAIYDNLCKTNDKVMADILFNSYFEYYHHLDIIDNGLYDCYAPEYVEKAQEQADKIHAQLDFVSGSNLLLEKLVSVKWDQQFLVVEPGRTITQSVLFDC